MIVIGEPDNASQLVPIQLAAVPLLKAFRLSCNCLLRDPVM